MIHCGTKAYLTEEQFTYHYCSINYTHNGLSCNMLLDILVLHIFQYYYSKILNNTFSNQNCLHPMNSYSMSHKSNNTYYRTRCCAYNTFYRNPKCKCLTSDGWAVSWLYIKHIKVAFWNWTLFKRHSFPTHAVHQSPT